VSRRLSDYRVLSFDCYGTLIDWETGIWDALRPLLMANHHTEVTRTSALQSFARFEAVQEAATPTAPYPAVLRSVHRAIADHFSLETTAELDQNFAGSVPNWPVFPDTADALRRLQTRYRLVILSNIDRLGFAASQRKMGVAFDAVLTAEEIGSYKPDRRNFEYMLARLHDSFGVEPSDVLHAAQSLYHDHVPAVALGLATAWIDRQRLSAGGDWGATAEMVDRPATDYTFFSLAELAATVEAEG
jgi:2-haloalkanoic acid dehalogenase type II